jgi:dihydropteroate synthase
MLLDGATFIDVGAYSSKTKCEHEEISENCSSSKFNPKTFSIISIDTFRSEVAKASIESGAAIINDISAGNLDEKMFEIKYNVPYIMMHMRGNPQTMQTLTNYEDIVKEMLFYFSKKWLWQEVLELI